MTFPKERNPVRIWRCCELHLGHVDWEVHTKHPGGDAETVRRSGAQEGLVGTMNLAAQI